MATAIFHRNYRGQGPRGRGFAEVSTFGAADATAGAAIAAVLDGYTTAQGVSLTQRIDETGRATAYEEGSRETATAILVDAAENGIPWKFSVRNWNPVITDIDFKKLLLGETGVVAGIVALTDPPGLPNSLNPVVVVNTRIVTKPGAI